MESILSDSKYVNEDHRAEDLFDFSSYIAILKSKVDQSPDKSIFGLIGNYGTGKSVMLEQFRLKVPTDAHWVHFDAWKYPDRNNLWEGFVLDFIRQISPPDFNKVLGKLDGTNKDDLKDLISTFGAFGNVILPGAGIAVDKLTHFAKSSPAKRVFQIQDLLSNLIVKKTTGDIYIVVEDADRSGEAGVYFVETLSHFLRTFEVEKKIKVFVPVSRKSYFSGRDAYIKALDYIEFFDLSVANMARFVEKIFKSSLLSDSMVRYHITEWLQRLSHVDRLTIREIKFIIRNADIRYKYLKANGHKPDARIVLIVESMKYLHSTTGQDDLSMFDEVIRSNGTLPANTQAQLLFFAIQRNANFDDLGIQMNQDAERGYFQNGVSFLGEPTTGPATDIPYIIQGKCVVPRYYIS